MKKIYFCEKGLTLVEIVVAMAISSLVIISIMQLSKTGSEVFNRGDQRSQKQMNIRLASSQIVETLRYAKFPEGDSTVEFIEFTDPNPIEGTPIKSEYDCIYFDDNENTLFHMDKKGKRRKLLDMKLDTNKDKSYFQLEVNNLISFKVTETTDDYCIESKIKLLNAEDNQFPTVLTPEKYRGIKYKE